MYIFMCVCVYLYKYLSVCSFILYYLYWRQFFFISFLLQSWHLNQQVVIAMLDYFLIKIFYVYLDLLWTKLCSLIIMGIYVSFSFEFCIYVFIYLLFILIYFYFMLYNHYFVHCPCNGQCCGNTVQVMPIKLIWTELNWE